MTVTAIRCGKCRGYHPTVDDVRRCYGGPASRTHTSWLDVERATRPERTLDQESRNRKAAQQRAERAEDVRVAEEKMRVWDASGAEATDGEMYPWVTRAPDVKLDAAKPWEASLEPAPAQRQESRATDKQVEFITVLSKERQIPPKGTDGYDATVEKFVAILRADLNRPGTDGSWITKQGASELITFLQSLPFKVEEDAPVPKGRYAIRGTDGVVRFYQVNRPEHGAHKGRTFVDQLIGAPGDYQHKPLRHVAREVLAKIAEDPEAASRLYGQEESVCGRCHSPLTDEESRAYGIGPVCRNKPW